MSKGKIDDQTLENVEILAQLNLSEEERQKARMEMEKILAYVDKLDELNTDDVTPLVHVLPAVNVFREDVVTNEDGRKEVLANAPKSEDDQFQVPKTV